MEKLIEIQSLIMKLESLMDLQYKSEFNFPDDERLIIKTFCRHHRITIENMVESIKSTVTWIIDNTTIEIMKLPD